MEPQKIKQWYDEHPEGGAGCIVEGGILLSVFINTRTLGEREVPYLACCISYKGKILIQPHWNVLLLKDSEGYHMKLTSSLSAMIVPS